MKKYVIGVDIGTQATRAGLFDIGGVCVCSASEKLKLLNPLPEAVTQSPEDIFGSVIRTVRETVLKSKIDPKDITAMSIAGQMAGIMGIDADWNPVTPYDSWLDTRCGRYAEIMKNSAEQEIIKSTGGQVTVAHGPKILWWKHECPEIYDRICKFVTPAAYAAGKLCGKKGDDAFIDYTYLHFTGFADNERICWNKTLLNEFGINEERLCRIAAPFEAIGTLKREWAAQMLLHDGVVVAAGCGDSAASSLGAGVTEPGIVYDVAGTASVFSMSAPGYAPDTEYRTVLYARSVLEELFIPLAYISGGGLCLRWFKELHNTEYELLDQEAMKQAPGSGGVCFIPHFSGRTCPYESEIKGAFIGLDITHGVGHMYRAIMESIGFEYSYYNNILKDRTGVSPKYIYGTGGGSASRVFCGIKADILGADYIPLAGQNAGIFGSALVGVPCGRYI